MLRQKYSFMTQVGDSLFVHAGIDPKWFKPEYPIYNEDGTVNIHEFNKFAWSLLKSDQQTKEILMDERSPLWTRMFMNHSDDRLCKVDLPQIRKLFKVKRIVVGHSIHPDGVKGRCDASIILSDFGMSAWKWQSRQGKVGFVHLHLKNGKVESVDATKASSNDFKTVAKAAHKNKSKRKIKKATEAMKQTTSTPMSRASVSKVPTPSTASTPRTAKHEAMHITTSSDQNSVTLHVDLAKADVTVVSPDTILIRIPEAATKAVVPPTPEPKKSGGCMDGIGSMFGCFRGRTPS